MRGVQQVRAGHQQPQEDKDRDGTQGAAGQDRAARHRQAGGAGQGRAFLHQVAGVVALAGGLSGCCSVTWCSLACSRAGRPAYGRSPRTPQPTPWPDPAAGGWPRRPGRSRTALSLPALRAPSRSGSGRSGSRPSRTGTPAPGGRGGSARPRPARPVRPVRPARPARPGSRGCPGSHVPLVALRAARTPGGQPLILLAHHRIPPKATRMTVVSPAPQAAPRTPRTAVLQAR